MQQQLKRYSEVRGRPPIDWNDRIKKMADGIVKEHSAEHAHYRSDSGSWVTCACGNQCNIIPRHKSSKYHNEGTPLDNILETLGVDFHRAIQNFNPKVAGQVLERIEERSAYLIKEILKKDANTITE